MIIIKNVIIGVLLTAAAILLEMFWISTGSVILAILSLVIALTASGVLARSLQSDYETQNMILKKFFTIVGLER